MGHLPSFYFLYSYITFVSVSGMQQFCTDSSECNIRVGATCQNSQCVPNACYQPSSSYRPCPANQSYGRDCNLDTDCANDLVCDLKSRRCECQRGRLWNLQLQACNSLVEEEYSVGKKYDLTRDVIIPSLFFATLTITVSLCYKWFCTQKSWRRRGRGADMARALEEAQIPYVGTSQPPTATWIASYRVFGTVERSAPPCLLLPIGPPTYEEALKHKVILSSYNPTQESVIETTPL